jgi:hypothetical protein
VLLPVDSTTFEAAEEVVKDKFHFDASANTRAGAARKSTRDPDIVHSRRGLEIESCWSDQARRRASYPPAAVPAAYAAALDDAHGSSSLFLQAIRIDPACAVAAAARNEAAARRGEGCHMCSQSPADPQIAHAATPVAADTVVAGAHVLLPGSHAPEVATHRLIPAD